MERNRGGRPRHPDVLTPAEWRVLDALRDGGTNAEIAARLGVSPDTVKTHISNMLAKLELRDRRALAAWRPDTPRRRLGGVLAVPAVGLAGTVGIVGVTVIFAVIIAGSREVMSCSSGVAVTDPETNSGLVADCESLLGLRDTIRGTRALNWTAGKPMSEWTGVTVSGTPQRVTALDLVDRRLDGQLSGLLGNLTSLRTLDLRGNALTGRLPSKLTLLTRLTSVTLDGTFEGCAPPGLTRASGLGECAAPTSTWDLQKQAAVPGGTFEFKSGDDPVVVFDVPEGSGLIFVAARHTSFAPGTEPERSGELIILRNAERTVSFAIDLEWVGNSISTIDDDFTSTGTASGYTRAEYEAIFKQIHESIWERVD